MILPILFLASLAFGQIGDPGISSKEAEQKAQHALNRETDAQQSIYLNSVVIDIKNLKNGRPTISGLPTYRNGIISKSSVTVSGGDVFFVNGSGSGITFQDGSRQTAAASSALANSSSTIIPLTTSAQGTCVVCIATVTITTTGFKVAAYVSGMLNQSGYASSGVHHSICVLQDGAFVAPYTSAVGINGWADGGQNFHDAGFRTIFQTAPSAGSHNYCIGLFNDSGRTLVFGNTFAAPIFGVEEVR